MAKFKNKDDFVEWILMKLGSPVLPTFDITEDQMLACIDEASDKFKDEASELGNVATFYTLPLSATKENYELIDDRIISIYGVLDDRLFGINTPFSVENQLASQGVIPYGIYSGGIDSRGALVDLELAWQYLELIKTKYQTEIQIIYNPLENSVRVIPTPRSDRNILLHVTRGLDGIHYWNHTWVRNYSLALSKIQLGTTRSTYQGVDLPGGGQLDGGILLQQGQDEKEKLQQELDDGLYSSPPFFEMG